MRDGRVAKEMKDWPGCPKVVWLFVFRALKVRNEQRGVNSEPN